MLINKQKLKQYGIPFIIGALLIGIIIGADILTKTNTTKELSREEINILKNYLIKNGDLGRDNIEVLIGNANCYQEYNYTLCKIPIYSKSLIDDFVIVKQDTPDKMRNTADNWAVNKLSEFASELKLNSKSEVITGGELTINEK